MNIAILSALVVLAVCALGPLLVSKGPTAAQLATRAFESVYGGFSPRPLLVVSHSYGFPAFEVKFTAKSEKERASDLNAAFKFEIGKLFKDLGSPLSLHGRFNPDLAVCFTYPGYVEEMLAELRAKAVDDSKKA